MPRVEIYTKTFCPYCWRAKHLLDTKGVDYVEVSVDFCGKSKAQMIERANGKRTVPQIFVAGQHIGGCDDLMALERDGRLDEIIAA